MRRFDLRHDWWPRMRLHLYDTKYLYTRGRSVIRQPSMLAILTVTSESSCRSNERGSENDGKDTVQHDGNERVIENCVKVARGQ